MVYPLAWQALIDSARLFAGRKIHRGGKRPLFEEPYGLYEGARLMTGLCTVFSDEWLRSDNLERRTDLP
jgi:hypothetical protein